MKKKNTCLMACGTSEISNITAVAPFLMAFIAYKKWYLCLKKNRHVNSYSNKGYSVEPMTNDFEIVIHYIINFIHAIQF